jgi:ribosomal protein S1
MPQKGLPAARQVHVNQHVRVRVTGIDHDRGRIALSMRGIDQPKQ